MGPRKHGTQNYRSCPWFGPARTTIGSRGADRSLSANSVPLDGSSRAESTLPLALRLANAESAELLLAHVVPVPELTEVGPLEAGDLELRGQLVRRNERVAHDYLDQIRARMVKGGISARTLVLCDGDVRSRLARAIVDEAVDLVVLSAQGRSGHSDVPFGSVAAYLIAHAVAPLLIMCRHSTRATRRVAAAGAAGRPAPEPRHAMTASASIPHPELLETAARALREHHRATNRMPRPIPVWASLPSMLDWRDRARACCAEPEPEATKAAEWFLDNDYQVQRAMLQVREDLPLAFYRRLPSVTSAVEEGLPRAFSLAHGLLNASHLQLSLPRAVQFLRAYQEDAPLTIAELWAFPTMLRLACLEIVFRRGVPTPIGAASI